MADRPPKKRPSWLADREPQGAASLPVGEATEPRPDRDARAGGASAQRTRTLPRVAPGRDERRAPEEPAGTNQEGTGPLPGRLRDGRLAVAVLAVAVLVAVLAGVGLVSGGEQETGAPPGGGAVRQADPGVRETGLAFGRLEVDGGKASLEGAGLSWEGDVAAGEGGETITLRGPTAVQVRRGFELPGSSVQSGVFAVAPEDGLVLHVGFQTFRAGASEVTQGSIFAVEDDRLVASGYYRDEREPGSETVIRTYMPPDGERYRVSFEAPQGTPVPLLVGWRGPAEEDGR